MSCYPHKGIVPLFAAASRAQYTYTVEHADEMIRLHDLDDAEPPALDPDLVEAREIVAREIIGYSKAIRAGEAWQERVDAILIGIKRGRELASGTE